MNSKYDTMDDLRTALTRRPAVSRHFLTTTEIEAGRPPGRLTSGVSFVHVAPPHAHPRLPLGPRHEDVYRFEPKTDGFKVRPLGSGGGVIPPLWLVQVDPTHVKVTSGEIAGFIPTGVATNIDVSGTNGTWSIWADVTIDTSGTPTAVDIGSGTTGVPAPSTYHGYFRIGEVDVASGLITAVRPMMAWDQAFVVCGRNTSDPGTTPGTYYLFFGSNIAAGGGGGGPFL